MYSTSSLINTAKSNYNEHKIKWGFHLRFNSKVFKTGTLRGNNYGINSIRDISQ